MAIKFLNTVAVDTDVLYVDASSNRVGIGTTSPSSKLQVNGDLTVGDNSTVGSFINVIAAGSSQDAGIRFGSESNTDSKAAIYTNTSNSDLHFDVTETTRMLIDSGTGNVGIGTTNPSQRLEVNGSAKFTGTIYTNAGELDSVGIVGKAIANGWAARYDSNNANYSGFFFDSNNDAGMVLRDDAGNMNVYLRSDSTSYFNGGNVGIGTNSPSQKLEVVGTISSGAGAGASNLGMDFGGLLTPSAMPSQVRGVIGALNSGTGVAAGSIGYQPRTGVSAAHIFFTEQSEKMRITSSGNVGIGTNSPGYKLDVAGDLRVDNGNVGSTSGDEVEHVKVQGARHFLKFKEVRTANDSDWKNTTFKLQTGVDSTNHQSIDFVTDGSYREHVDIRTGNQVFNTRFTYDGKVGIGTTSPAGKLSIGSGLSTDNSTMFNVNGRYNDVGFNGGTSGLLNQGVWSFINSATWDQTRFYVQDQNNSDSRLTFDFKGNAGNKNILAGTSSGNVGIGTTSPTQKLDVRDGELVFTQSSVNQNPSGRIRFNEYGNSTVSGSYMEYNGASNYFSMFTNSETVNYEFLRAARGSHLSLQPSSGNVGIGTTSPSEKLHVYNGKAYVTPISYASNQSAYALKIGAYNNTAFDMGLQAKSTSGGSPYMSLRTPSNDDTLVIWGDKVGIKTAPNLSYNLDINGTLRTVGDSYFDDDIHLGRYIFHAGDTNTWLGFPTSDTISFRTNNSDRMYINSSGNVGIGTTSPGAKLEVEQSNSSTNTVFLSNSYNNKGFRTGNSGYATFSGYQDANNTASGGAYGALIGLNTFYNGTNFYNDNQYVDPSSILFKDGNILFHTNDISATGNFTPNERLRITKTGNVGIGTTSPTSKFHVKQTLASPSVPMVRFEADIGPSTYGAVNVRVDNLEYGAGMRFVKSATYDSNAVSFYNGASPVGTININASSTSYNTTSDYRLKENLTKITDGIDRLKQLKPKRFNFIGETSVVDGFIAHEAKEVVPESVTGEKDEVLPNGDPVYQGIDQAKIVPLLTAALQEAITKIEELEARIQTLEN